MGQLGEDGLQEPQREGAARHPRQHGRGRLRVHERGEPGAHHPVLQAVLELRRRHDVGYVAAVPERGLPGLGVRLAGRFRIGHDPDDDAGDDDQGYHYGSWGDFGPSVRA